MKPTDTEKERQGITLTEFFGIDYICNMDTFLGGIGGIKGVKKEKGYNVYFYHKRNEELESEFVIANSEKEAIKIATEKHRLSYPRIVFEFFKIK